MQTNLPLSVRQDGNPDAQTALSPSDATGDGARGFSRRSLLGSLGAFFGLTATPTAALGTLAEVAAGAAAPTADSMTVATVLWHHWKDEPPSVWKLYSDLGAANESLASLQRVETLRDDRHSVGTLDISFPRGGRCYIAICCVLDVDEFTPQHWLDIPPDQREGNSDSGIECGAYDFSFDRIVSREEAFRQMQEGNLGVCEGGPADDWTLRRGSDWYCVLQLGSLLDDGSNHFSVDSLHKGIAKADLSLDLAVRLVHPTEAEVARFGKVVSL